MIVVLKEIFERCVLRFCYEEYLTLEKSKKSQTGGNYGSDNRRDSEFYIEG